MPGPAGAPLDLSLTGLIQRDFVEQLRRRQISIFAVLHHGARHRSPGELDPTLRLDGHDRRSQRYGLQLRARRYGLMKPYGGRLGWSVVFR